MSLGYPSMQVWYLHPHVTTSVPLHQYYQHRGYIYTYFETDAILLCTWIDAKLRYLSSRVSLDSK